MFCVSRWCQWGPLWEYTSRPKNRKLGKFPQSRAQTAGDRIYIIYLLNEILPFSPLKKHIPLQWYVKSYTFQVFRKSRWAKESEMTACIGYWAKPYTAKSHTYALPLLKSMHFFLLLLPLFKSLQWQLNNHYFYFLLIQEKLIHSQRKNRQTHTMKNVLINNERVRLTVGL